MSASSLAGLIIYSTLKISVTSTENSQIKGVEYSKLDYTNKSIKLEFSDKNRLINLASIYNLATDKFETDLVSSNLPFTFSNNDFVYKVGNIVYNCESERYNYSIDDYKLKQIARFTLKSMKW
ncbi:MAG: hypothetical protein Q9M91_03160 [Candidatus Dojkabacteria bacterium]|nr:hypothetical protein [Candidatus Dojkabacteria bacterium]